MGICPHALFSHFEEDLRADLSLTAGYQFLDTNAFGDSSRVLAASRCRASLLKKLLDEELPGAEDRAFALWSHYNDRCEHYSVSLNTSSEEVLWGEFKRSLHHFFTDGDFSLPWKNILENSKVGPGVTILAKSTDMYSKLFSSPLSATSSGLHRIYRSDTMMHPTRFQAEESRSGQFGSSVVKGSRLAFVPKTRNIRRSICVEPNLNIYLQLGLASILTDRLRSRFGISLVDQADKNRELARLGSLDDSFATIDLSSASDSISISLLEEVLPPHVLGMLMTLRSPYTEYKGKWIELHMISSMGNGCTFPLQTILFSCMVEAAYRCCGMQLDKPFAGTGNFGVFGDDIIVTSGGGIRSEAYRNIITLLRLSGFVVNPEKSFEKGPFRESCGREYYLGCNVRGVYIKTLRTVAGRYVAINRLLEWSAIHGIDLPNTISYLVRSVPRFRIPPDGPIDGGIRVPFALVRTSQPRDRNLSVRYSYLAPRASFLSFDENCRPRGMARKLGLSVNPFGLWMSFLAGHLRDGKIGIRSRKLSYHRRDSITPNWNNCSLLDGLSSRHGRQRWLATAYETLTGVI